jgi:hypothetical protein
VVAAQAARRKKAGDASQDSGDQRRLPKVNPNRASLDSDRDNFNLEPVLPATSPSLSLAFSG